jgi:hypothetical protein
MGGCDGREGQRTLFSIEFSRFDWLVFRCLPSFAVTCSLKFGQRWHAYLPVLRDDTSEDLRQGKEVTVSKVLSKDSHPLETRTSFANSERGGMPVFRIVKAATTTTLIEAVWIGTRRHPSTSSTIARRMKGFNAQGNHHLFEDDGSDHEFSLHGEVEPSTTRTVTRTSSTARTVLDPPGSIRFQLARSMSDGSSASLRSSPAFFGGSGSGAEIRSILRKPSVLRRSHSSHEPSSSSAAAGHANARARFLGHRSKSERNVTNTCQSKAKRKIDPKQPAHAHNGPGSFLADLVAARRQSAAFVSVEDGTDSDWEEEEETAAAEPASPPRLIHTTTAARRTERRSQGDRTPFDRACPLEGPAVASTIPPGGDASMATAGSEEHDASDCPFDEDFLILQRRASERSLQCRDAYVEDSAAVQLRTWAPVVADIAPARLSIGRGADRLAPDQRGPSDHRVDDVVRAGSSNASIAQISIENPSVVAFVPHGCFGTLPGSKGSYPPPHEDSTTAKPSLCGTIATTTTTTASSEEASSLEDSSSERSQPVHVMVNLSYLELTKASSFSDEVCYLVD